VKEQEQPGENQKHKSAGFSATGTSGQPIRPVVRHFEQVTRQGLAIVAGVRFGKYHHIGVVGDGMEPDGKPQTPGAPHGQTPEQPVEANTDAIALAFHRF
jgi:hypothetical protein